MKIQNEKNKIKYQQETDEKRYNIRFWIIREVFGLNKGYSKAPKMRGNGFSKIGKDGASIPRDINFIVET